MARKKYEENRRKKLEEEKKKNIALKTNTKEFIKSKMQRSLSQPQMYKQELNLEEKKNKKRPDFRKRSIKTDRTKMKRCESENADNKKKFIRLNAYNDVNRIIDFIDHSRNNSQSKICRGHFANIQMAKNFNNSLQKMINKNYITYK